MIDLNESRNTAIEQTHYDYTSTEANGLLAVARAIIYLADVLQEKGK